MGAIALGSPWLQSTSGFPMGAIALGSPWLIQMRISYGRHRPRISVAAIHIRISHGGSPWLQSRLKVCFVVDASYSGFRIWLSLVSHVLVSTKSTIAYTSATILPSSVTRTLRIWRTLMLWIQMRKLPSLQTTSESRPLEGMHNRCVSDDRPTQQGTASWEQNGLPLSIGAVIKLVRCRPSPHAADWVSGID